MWKSHNYAQWLHCKSHDSLIKRGVSGQNHKTPGKNCSYFKSHNTPPYLYIGNFSTILLLIMCAFKSYAECLYRHISLEDTCTNIKVTKKMHPQSSSVIIRFTHITAKALVSHTPILVSCIHAWVSHDCGALGVPIFF